MADTTRPMKVATQKLGSLFSPHRQESHGTSFLLLGPATGSTDSFPDVVTMSSLPSPPTSPRMLSPAPSPPQSPVSPSYPYPFTTSTAIDFATIASQAKPQVRVMGRGGAGSRQRTVLPQPRSQPQTPTKTEFFPPSPTSSLFPGIDLPAPSTFRIPGRGVATSRARSPEKPILARKSKSHSKLISSPTLVYSSNMELASPTAATFRPLAMEHDRFHTRSSLGSSHGRSEAGSSPTSSFSDVLTPTDADFPGSVSGSSRVQVVRSPAGSLAERSSRQQLATHSPSASEGGTPQSMKVKKKPAYIHVTPAIPDFLHPNSPLSSPPSRPESPREGYFPRSPSPLTGSSLSRASTPFDVGSTPTISPISSTTAVGRAAPRKSWIGRWNGQDIQDIMHKLRMLR